MPLDDRSPASTPTDTTARSDNYLWLRLRRLLGLLTFVDLPIKQKFLLLTVGTLFWFGSMAVVTVLALTAIQYKYHQVSEQIMPHQQAAHEVLRHLQNIDRDLQFLGQIDTGLDLLAVQSLREHVKAIRAVNARLSLHQSVPSGTFIETVVRSLATPPAANLQYLQNMVVLTDRLDQSLDTYITTKRKMPRPADTITVASSFDDTRARVAEGTALVNQHASRMAGAYGHINTAIYQIIGDSVNAILIVLLIASTLLMFFVRWIIVAFQRPIATIIRQIDSLSTGDITLAKKVAVKSQDEIGTLSSKFNILIDSVYGMTIYKKVIEEDADLDDVYHRLGDVFQHELGIAHYTIYDINTQKNEMRVVHPALIGDVQLHCDPEVLSNCQQCRAVNTGHTVSSFEFHGVCRRFVPQPGVGHICIPLVAGGHTGGVVQLRFATDKRHGLLDSSTPQKIFEAETYINQSLSVIEAKRLMQTLRESAMVDPLTGLYNRRFLQEHTAQIISGVLRRKTQIGLLVCDLDYFKQVNDAHGHDAGDQVLRETSIVMKKTVRDSDIVIRFGGEEFLILLMDVQPGDALVVAEKIRKSIEALKVSVGDKILQKTISIGVAEFPGDTDGFWQAIKYADVALYRAKDLGRNQCVRFDKEMWQHGGDF
ncbi:GGDEF domain-containing protein [Simplicispira psychrophila]|uniref:GGDEF domain-containing protein n=1 Tax=Simplicispira psychrophila TaxID=80882 RepID=UPI0006898131|nr:GGDEF domain-containing protein [Simplicispira psychrophila]